MADEESALCEPGLVFWLVEELLDSQTIDGCRIVFDYLDSRRERLTAVGLKFHNRTYFDLLNFCDTETFQTETTHYPQSL